MSYYLKYAGIIYKLDATSDISVSYPARTTSHPTHSKKVASDNYILDNPTASINGFITDIKTPTSLNPLGAGKYIDELLSIRGRRVGVSFKHRLDGEEEDNWYITSFTPSQSQNNGFGGIDASGSVVQAFKISMTLERVTQARGVRTDVIVPESFANDLASKSSSNKSTQEFEEAGGDTPLSNRQKAGKAMVLAREQLSISVNSLKATTPTEE